MAQAGFKPAGSVSLPSKLACRAMTHNSALNTMLHHSSSAMLTATMPTREHMWRKGLAAKEHTTHASQQHVPPLLCCGLRSSVDHFDICKHHTQLPSVLIIPGSTKAGQDCNTASSPHR